MLEEMDEIILLLYKFLNFKILISFYACCNK